MTHQERDRLVFSLVLALVIHAGIIVTLSLVDWKTQEYPETNTVFIEFIEYESVPPPIEPTPELAEETPPESVEELEPEEPQPPEEPIAEDPPVDNQLAAVTPDAEPEPPADVAAETETPAPQIPTPEPVGRDAPPGSFDLDDPFARDDSTAEAREEARPTGAELFTFDEARDSGQLPAWVAEGTIQPLSSLALTDQRNLAEKENALEGFAELMEQITQSLISPQSTLDQNQPGTEDGAQFSEVSLPGDSSLDWVGGGSRSAVGRLALPQIDSEDLGGLVPPRLTYVIVFDVNADGVVVPGSLILRNSSGYTAADQIVRRVVSSWHFEPAPGSQPVTAICTLILERDDLR